MAVRDAVDEALRSRTRDWRVAIAERLADLLDGEDPNASVARELRALMSDLADSAPSTGDTPLDELRRRRKRGAAAAG